MFIVVNDLVNILLVVRKSVALGGGCSVSSVVEQHECSLEEMSIEGNLEAKKNPAPMASSFSLKVDETAAPSCGFPIIRTSRTSKCTMMFIV